MRGIRKFLKGLGIFLGCSVLILGSLFAYWFLRPNSAQVNAGLGVEAWDVVAEGRHNSNTHLIEWNGEFWLVHANSPYHFASTDCRLIVWRSADAKQWEKVTEFNVPGEDIRDPKMAVIGGRLFLYVLKDVEFTAEPYTTAYTSTADGETWDDLKQVEGQDGWLFWIPRTRDGMTWYAAAYWHEHGKAALMRTTDGVNWTLVSLIHPGIPGSNDRCDETDFEFLPDGRMIATSRIEVSDSYLGDARAHTEINVSSPPYGQWTVLGDDYSTRLDGPALFDCNGLTFAVGRRNPEKPGFFTNFGSILAKKRTALYVVTEKGLVYLSDLPSAGDTSYEGVILKDGYAWISYYTSDANRDYPWILGMVSASDIRMAKVPLDKLEALAKEKLAEYDGQGLYNLKPVE
jgi:hypothetical protein